MGPQENEVVPGSWHPSLPSKEEVACWPDVSASQMTKNHYHHPNQGCACSHPSCLLGPLLLEHPAQWSIEFET